MNATLALVGNPDDLCAAYVKWVAQQRGIELLELPESELGAEWSFAFDDCAPEAGELTVRGVKRALGSIDSLFVRLFHQPKLPQGCDGVSPEHEALLVVERRASLQHLLASFPRVVNPPSAGRSNASKPFQMKLLERAGFRVPRWIATNDREALASFVANCADGAIYKSCSGLRSRVRRVDDELQPRLAASTPVIAQEYIAGRDVRVHTVLAPDHGGAPHGRAFPTEVRSKEGVDYRWDPGQHDFAACEIPSAVEATCYRVARDEGLILAGFDFRVTDAGEWFCLEVNPVPTFITYQAATRQEIGESVVERMLQR
jgi:hypothetical protein